MTCSASGSAPEVGVWLALPRGRRVARRGAAGFGPGRLARGLGVGAAARPVRVASLRAAALATGRTLRLVGFAPARGLLVRVGAAAALRVATGLARLGAARLALRGLEAGAADERREDVARAVLAAGLALAARAPLRAVFVLAAEGATEGLRDAAAGRLVGARAPDLGPDLAADLAPFVFAAALAGALARDDFAPAFGLVLPAGFLPDGAAVFLAGDRTGLALPRASFLAGVRRVVVRIAIAALRRPVLVSSLIGMNSRQIASTVDKRQAARLPAS